MKTVGIVLLIAAAALVGGAIWGLLAIEFQHRIAAEAAARIMAAQSEGRR